MNDGKFHSSKSEIRIKNEPKKLSNENIKLFEDNLFICSKK